MVSFDDMRGYIQEWMGQCTSPVDLAKTYATCLAELEGQLEYVMDSLTSET